jgi:hypothetical protein
VASVRLKAFSEYAGKRAIDGSDEKFVMFREPGHKLMESLDKTAWRDRAAKPRAQLRLWY